MNTSFENIRPVPWSASAAQTTSTTAARVARWWPFAVIGFLAVLLWAPRLNGPIDLRYDAGVYFLLGKSLAEGSGYRITSEPGAPVGVQYPPALPAIVALHAKVLGTTDPLELGRWLRRSYCAMFCVFALSVVGLARNFLSPLWATVAAAVCLLQLNTYLMSDLLFSELPFALLCVLFVWLYTIPPERVSGRTRDAVAFFLASAAFMLRSAGVALLAAWVGEAVLRRRWRSAIARALLAALPFGLWQAHVSSVRSSIEYQQPAYAYQRAPYQFYNVTYAENMALLDPFQPELGRANAGDLLDRLLANIAVIPSSIGEAVSTTYGFWRWALNDLQDSFVAGRPVPEEVVGIPLWALAMVVGVGLAVLAWRGSWMIVLVVAASVALVCSTPWPGQFSRYLAPLVALFTIGAVVGAQHLCRLALKRSALLGKTVMGFIGALGILTVAAQGFTVKQVFERRQNDPAMPVMGSALGHRMFYHDRTWAAWEKAAAWINERTAPDAIVATTAPHLLHLWTDRRAVFPPMEIDPARCRALLEDVPVSYVIVDEFTYLDISRRYGEPAVSDPATGWRVVFENDRTRIYASPTKGD